MGLVGRAKGTVFVISSLVAGTLGVFIYGWLTLPIFFIKPVVYRRFFDRMLGWYSHYLIGLIELVLGVKIKITGDIIRPGERNLIMMNHRTRLDWMYFWSVLIRQSGITTEKVILKAPLKKIPGLGWAMQVGAFIFIERKWEEDKKILNKMIGYFSDIKHRTQILLFPEGTDLTARTKAKSDEFALKNNVPTYEYVLHPRTTGFTYITQYMRQKDHLDAVYDVTVAYPYNVPQQELDIVTGNFPEEVHFHIKRHPVQSLPITEDGLQDWCKKRWQEKEQKLKKFYEQLHFEENALISSPTTSATSNQDNIANNNGDINNKSKSNSENNHQKREMERKIMDNNAKFYMRVALVTWTCFIVTILAILVYTSYGLWIAFAQGLFFIFMTFKYGGFELFQVDYYNNCFKVINNSKKLK